MKPNNNTPDNCPACNVSWIGDPIPDDMREHYGESTHWRREIGIEIQGEYDGVSYWECPDCGKRFNRNYEEQS